MAERIIDLILLLKQKCLMEEEVIRGEVGMLPSEVYCLDRFPQGEKVSCNSLSKRMNVSSSRGSRIIDCLVEKGYLARTENSNDRRYKEITLTEKGTNVIKKIKKAKNKCEKKLTGAMDDSQIEIVRKGLRTLIDKI